MRPKFRVIVAGSRNFHNAELLHSTLDKLLANVREDHDVVVVSGGARGADTVGEAYARVRGYPVERYPADWKRYGKRAGYLRNERMAVNANGLVAFWDGHSRGTKHMIDIATQKNIDVRVVRF